LLIALNVAVSMIAFSMMTKPAGAERFFFSPSDVAEGRNYLGMVLSHFSHADGAHLLFNMVTLYYFGPVVEAYLGTVPMLLIYIAAGIASTVFVYYLHRKNPRYRALGASDSISGVLFAAIVLAPEMTLFLMIVPIPIPAPIFAVGYLLLSMFWMRRGGGNISHEAHLAGAFAGLILAGLLSPDGFRPLIFELQSLF